MRGPSTSLLLIQLTLQLHAAPLPGERVNSHSCPRQALFLIHKGQINSAIELYDSYYQSVEAHDAEFLQQLGLSLLDQGSRSTDPEIQLMAIFGAGIAMNENALPILTKAISSPLPPLQLLALNFLGRYHNEEADRYVLQALQSNYLIVRIEALHQIALKKQPKAANHIESLMGKVDPALLPLFPQLLGLVGDADSIRMLRKLLSHPNEEVRIEAIISAANCGRDDLLPKILILATHPSTSQQEACALALGELRDESSKQLLKKLSRTYASSPTVSLAALSSLYEMGDAEALESIKTYAQYGNPFAVTLLGEIPGTEETLFSLTKSSDFTMRINATVALLRQQDVRCLPLLAEILIKDSRDLVFTKITSRGKGLSYWRAVPSARQQFGESTIELELSLHFRESCLADAVNLPEDSLLKLITLIFDKQQNDLVPAAIALLEALQTPKAIALLKRHQQSPGAPLVRSYCNLALYRLGEEGPYEGNLIAWMQQRAAENLIQLRPYVPWELDDEHSLYQITPHESSRLLIETFEAVTKKQDHNGINGLLKAIKNGNHKNKYALAGLLIRATL